MLKPNARTISRKEKFKKLGEAISRIHALRGYDGDYQFDLKPVVSHDRASAAFGGKLGKSAPREKTWQLIRTKMKPSNN